MRKIIVIGSGPAGVTCAYQLARSKRVSVELYEKEGEVGGLSRSIRLWGDRVDLGPHRFFCQDKHLGAFWMAAIGHDFHLIQRITRIYYRKRFFNYPLRMANALFNLGIWMSLACLFSYLQTRLRPPKQDHSFESRVIGFFGRKLYLLFFASYTAKLWGCSGKDLDEDFAQQRIKGFTLIEAICEAIWRRPEKHKTLVEEFAYPIGGAGMAYESMAADFICQGGTLHLNTPINRVLIEAGKVMGVQLATGEIRVCDQVVSTMPITDLLAGMPDLPEAIREAASTLSFRNTLIVYIEVLAGDLFEDQWIYIHDPDLAVGRLTNFSNWGQSEAQKAGRSVLALEYWCGEDDAVWTEAPERIIARAKAELRQTGLIGEAAIGRAHVQRLAKSYPVYALGYKEQLALIQEYLDSIEGLVLIGRYGAYKYNNQDHSILMGLLASENLLGEARHNLWEINTDYIFQEEPPFAVSGLTDQA